MNKYRWLVPVSILAISALNTAMVFAGDQSAEDWYRDSYAPLWEDPTAENMNAAIAHYAEMLNYHAADGSFEVAKNSEWMQSAIDSWAEEAWVSSKMTELKTKKVNDSTYVMISKWQDTYDGADDSFSCGWYLVGKTEVGWRITTFADYACKD